MTTWITSKTLCWAKETTHKNVYTVRIHLYKALEKTKLIYNDRKQISGCPSLGVGWENWLGRDTKKLLGGDENVLYIGCAGSCTGTYFCQNSLNITFKNGHILLYLNDTSFHQVKWENARNKELNYVFGIIRFKVNLNEKKKKDKSHKLLPIISTVFREQNINYHSLIAYVRNELCL